MSGGAVCRVNSFSSVTRASSVASGSRGFSRSSFPFSCCLLSSARLRSPEVISPMDPEMSGCLYRGCHIVSTLTVAVSRPSAVTCHTLQNVTWCGDMETSPTVLSDGSESGLGYKTIPVIDVMTLIMSNNHRYICQKSPILSSKSKKINPRIPRAPNSLS